MGVHYRLRGFVQVACPGVVAKTGPQMKNLIGLCRGECIDGCEARHEAFEVGYDGGDLSLLQHYLRDPDAIGRAVGLPRQVMTAVLIEPVQKLLREESFIAWHWSRDRRVNSAGFEAGLWRRLSLPLEVDR